MRDEGSQYHDTIVTVLIDHVNELYWSYFQSLDEITLLTIYNLDLDLMYLYKYCAKNLSGYPRCKDSLKSLQ